MADKKSYSFIMSDSMYNFAKKLVQIILPATGTLYFALAGIWDLPHADQVVGTLVALCTFLGICLGISTAQYAASGKAFDGHLTVEPNQDGGLAVRGLHFDGVPSDLVGKNAVTFKIQQKAPVAQNAEVETDLPTDSPL